MTRYNNIHRQQLFHWIGQHIEGPGTARPRARAAMLTTAQREEYVRCLETALHHGLWLNRPRLPDQLGDGTLVRVTRPIVCFTEWSLGESLPHTARYGRMGFGFSKRFVLEHGGQPVSYVRDRRSVDPYTRALLELAAFFQRSQQAAKRSRARLDRLAERFDYLAHFVKRIRSAPTRRLRTPGTAPQAPARKAARIRTFHPHPFDRAYGRPLNLLEEREWRIVHDDSLARHFRPGRNPPAFYLPFASGKELFTLVLPDNETVHLVAKNRSLRQALYPAAGPHVTLLSLQDIGTF